MHHLDASRGQMLLVPRLGLLVGHKRVDTGQVAEAVAVLLALALLFRRLGDRRIATKRRI